MTKINADFEGFQQTARKFRELEEQYDGDGVTYVVGTGVKYGLWLEIGTEDMPAYEWFKPAIREFRRDPEGFVLDTTDYSRIEDIPSTEALVQAVAIGLEGRMTDNVNAQDPSRDRSPGADKDHPRRDTGNLTASIQAVRIN